jgi:hypothetical protein
VPRSALQALSIRRQRRSMVACCSVFDVDDRGGSATELPEAGVVQCPALCDPVWHRLAHLRANKRRLPVESTIDTVRLYLWQHQAAVLFEFRSRIQSGPAGKLPLAKLGFQDLGQQVGPGRAACDQVRRRRRLRNGLARPAGEFFSCCAAWNKLTSERIVSLRNYPYVTQVNL